jgi:hypothetical protein
LRATELTPELLRDVAELHRRLENWRPEQSGKARHLFYLRTPRRSRG